MIRTVITPSNQTVYFEIPKNYVGKKLEIIAFTIDEATQEPKKKNTMSQFWGVMSKQTAADLHQQIEISRNEWKENI